MTAEATQAALEAAPSAPSRARRIGAFAALTAGLLAAVGVALFVGVEPVAKAAASVGFGGFAVVVGAWCALLAWLGLAWFAGAPGLPARTAGRYVWARFVREGAADLLPFSQLGGVVLGARTAALAAPAAIVWASLVIDLTTEMASQVVYTLGGVAGLGWRLTGGGGRADGDQAGVLWAAGALLAGGVGLLVAFVVLQRRSVNLVGALMERVLPGAASHAQAVSDALSDIWRRRDRVLLATLMHGGGWVGNGFVSWLALHLMGARLGFLTVLTVESLLLAVKSFGFAIPGALGLQEGAYAVIGPLFGLPAETALALSFLKRARDLAVGAPVLVAWNALEGRSLLRRRSPAPRGPAAA